MMLMRLVRRYDYALKRWISTTARKNGYIVLVPEIGEDLPEKNALLRPDGLPEFNNITIEICLSAIGSQATALEKQVLKSEEIIESKGDELSVFDDVINELEEPTLQLETTWGIAKALYLGNSSLMPTKSYLNIHERAKRARAAKYSNRLLYDTISKSLPSLEKDSSEKKRLAEKYILEGKLNGLLLSDDKKANLSIILDKLGKERANFKNKVEVSVQQFCRTITDYSLVRAFPAEYLENIAMDSRNPTNGPWKILLRSNMVSEFLKHCPDRAERWNVWQANIRKASGYAEKSLDNSGHIENIRQCRQNQAELLGYPNYVAMSMETKMIKNIKSLNELLENLRETAFASQLTELKKLEDFAVKSGFSDKLDLYDIPYWSRKHLKAVHNFDEQAIKEYFPLPKVLTGIFYLCEKLFKIKIVERDVEAWHRNVKCFDIFEEIDSSKPIAGFYLDCYSRDNNQTPPNGNSGWTVAIRNRSLIAETLPLSALIFNFRAPMYGKPCLLSIQDLQMVLRNFGSAMQHLLTRANYNDLAGLSNIEWDASQVSSYVMAFFLTNRETYKIISGHYNTNEEISDEQFQSIKAYLNHTAGIELSRELYMAALDLELHTSKNFWLDIVKELWPKYMSIPLEKKDSHPCSWTDIFSGDWAAAYFSHIHSKIIAADVYTSFTENKDKTANIMEVGTRFRDTFLSHGGSVSTAEVFRRFRGRDPSPTALLKSLNLQKNV